MRGLCHRAFLTMIICIASLHHMLKPIVYQADPSGFYRTYFYRISALTFVYSLSFFTEIHVRSHFLIHSLLFAIKPTIVKLH